MNELPPSRTLIRFGVFELDTETGELLKQGSKVRLQEQPFQILRILLENRGKVVTREDLQHRIWPADTFVDFDRGLYNAIRKLREALGDDAEKPRFIETLSKRGYRFIASVQSGSPPAPAEALTLPPTSTQGDAPKIRRKFASGGQADSEGIAVSSLSTGEPSPKAELTSTSLGRRTIASLIETVSKYRRAKRVWTIIAAVFALGCVALALAQLNVVKVAGLRGRIGASDTSAIRSIAVLPLANASKNPEMDYLGEGISEEITNSLSRFPDLHVMARSTVARYKARQDDAQGVGRDLHVEAVLTGHVIEHGGGLDIETELVSVATGTQLWGQRYTRSFNEASLLQATITRDVASKLRPGVEDNRRAYLAKIGTQNAEAYHQYLKGRYHFDRWTQEGFKVAAGFFEKAVAMDSSYAAAYAGLADAYALQAYFGYLPGNEAFPKSREAARRALELDSEIPESHISLAISDMMFFHKFSEAQVSLQKALALDPNSAYVHDILSWLANVMGRSSDAIAEGRKAVELDPLSLRANIDLASTYYLARDYNQSLQQANRSLEIDPNNTEAIQTIGWVYEVMGDNRAAIQQWIRNEQVLGNERRAKELKQVYEKSGYPGYLRRDAKDKEAQGDFYDAASDYALLGEKDAAMTALQRATDAGQETDYLLLDPALDNVRSDPRYKDLIRRVGLPQ